MTMLRDIPVDVVMLNLIVNFTQQKSNNRTCPYTMTFTPDDQAPKRPSDSRVQPDGLQVGHEEPPPRYPPQTRSVVSGSVPSSPAPHSPAFKSKPTNFLALSDEHDRDAVRGEFIIDPCIRIPPSMLPLLDEGETEDDRKNLRLTSRFSSVNAEIGLLGSPSAPKPRRTTIALTSDYGSIHAQLHTFDGAAPFSLIARASHGTIRLAIPRSFQGLLSVSTHHGSISISDTIVQNATQLGQRGTTRRCFVGDFHLVGRDEWQGDQVEIEASHGSIRVKYVDEVGIMGVLSRLFAKLFCFVLFCFISICVLLGLANAMYVGQY